MPENIVLEGAISVLAALAAGNRVIKVVYLQQNKSAALAAITRQAGRCGVPVERVDESVITAYATGHSHGGVVALAGPRRFQSLDTLGRMVANPLIVMLDGVEDPFNFGQAVRALYAAGVHGLVIRARNWGAGEGIIVRASAGAAEWMPTAVVDSVHAAVTHFKTRGLTVICTAATGSALALYEANLQGPLFLVVGGERRGIAQGVLQEADLVLRIPYGGSFGASLGTTSAVAVLAFEVLRQRLYAQGATIAGE